MMFARLAIALAFLGAAEARFSISGGIGRRLKEEAHVIDENDQKYFLNMCGDHQYQAFLYVDSNSHFFAVAMPGDDAALAGCPPMAVNAVFSELPAPTARKEIALWENIDAWEQEFASEALPVGTFKFSKLHQAYHNANVEGEYDIIKNNCASFMVTMASNLGINLDTSVTSYVTRRLVENAGSEVYESIKQSAHYLSLFPRGRNLRSENNEMEDTIEFLVQKTVTGLV